MVVERFNAWVRLVQGCEGKPPPAMPGPKKFEPKCKHLPKLNRYTERLPATYWAKWTKRGIDEGLIAKSWVNSMRLKELAETLGYGDTQRLLRVCDRLENGADIGCRGRGRLQTKVKNNPSAYEYGDRVADSLQDWIEQESPLVH